MWLCFGPLPEQLFHFNTELQLTKKSFKDGGATAIQTKNALWTRGPAAIQHKMHFGPEGSKIEYFSAWPPGAPEGRRFLFF